MNSDVIQQTGNASSDMLHVTGSGVPVEAAEGGASEPTAEVASPDQPFEEGAHDAIDPDLRHRLISETAYRHYVDRNYEDGYDVDDWLQAETEVDHLLLNPARAQ